MSLIEQDGVTACYLTHAPLVRSYLRRFVPPQDIEDVLQVVFAEVWRCRHRYDPGRSLEAWLQGIARNRAIDYLRARPPATVSLDLVPEPRDHHDPVGHLGVRDQVRRALAVLPAPQREAIELAYYYELSQREIAVCLDVPLGTVKARTARALHRLSALVAA
ncbi:DNA-directed RNA polymerase sigma-70 factor [Acrocarpospora corrugata]|uniref:RNA polymerase sigma factor n=1 Tax=Acrocarpospora corrugata TaxID=35763 RepID=A0A5M3W0I7_9ACTN|nr:sigma-70 family RNA polymerase sigma factor [Acrocarpospora corrugata]GES02555.1 DNA-directed RNA polymerase sigma-70 factor [Acrocarpospora corrugata]